MSSVSHRDDPAWEQSLDWLMRIQASPLDDDLLRQRDRWMAEDEGHARAYRKAEKVWRLTGQVAPVFPAPAASPAPAVPIRAGHVRRATVLSMAAAVAACLALALLPGIARTLRSDYHTGTGETRQVVLGDGSIVMLDAESAIAVSLSSERRVVTLLSGHAFFQVVADRTRPFVVSAKEMTVTVTGTAFDVSSIDGDAKVEVRSGTVSVTAAHDGSQMTATLKRGGRARVSRLDGRLAVDSVPPPQVGLWRSGRMVVNGATIAQMVEELRRHHRGIILLRDEALAARQVTGVFDLADPVAALDAALQPHGGMVRELTPYVLVVSAR